MVNFAQVDSAGRAIRLPETSFFPYKRGTKDVSGEKSIYVWRYFLFVNVVGNFFISVNFYFSSVFGYGNVC